MNSFGEVLNKSLEEAGISQIAAAKAAGVSRAMIYNIINLPDKALSEGKFLKMIGELPFTDAQTDRLRKEYYRPKYPDGVIEKIYRIREYMAGAIPDIARTKDDDFVPPPPENSTGVSDKRRIIEIAQAIIEASTERIITNYPFENQELDNAVFSSLNRSSSKTGEFIHIVEFDQSNKSLKNIDNIFKSVRYCRIGFAPVYCYSVGLGEFNSSLFPYFFLTESYGLLFNENGSDGIFTNNEDFVKQLTIAANKLSSSCEPLGAFCDNVFKIKDHFQRLSGSKTIGCFCNHMCTLPISPPEVFEAGTSDNLPNREIFVQLVTNHYIGMRKFYDDEWHVMPEDSIDDYVKNGPQYDVPKSLMNTLPNEMRRLVLQRFYDIAKDNPKAYFFADKSIINFSDPCFNIEIYGSAVCIYGSLPTSEDPFSGQYRIFVKNKNIAQDFVYCKGFLERSGLYHSGEWMLSKISEAIESCKN